MRKIALVGTAASGLHAPYNDPSVEIWGVSARADYVTRADRWFELHRLDGEPKAWANKWRETMRTFTSDVELLMLYPEPDLGPRVTNYPVERISNRFGTFFMTSTFAWMMALAIDELRPINGDPVEGEISIYGVDMEYDTEYVEQRAGFRHFIQLARFAGIPVARLASGGLAYEPVPYPLWQDDPLRQKVERRINEVASRLKNADNTQRQTRSLLAQIAGARSEAQAMLDDASYSAVTRLRALEEEHRGLMEASSNISKEIVFNEGMQEELKWLKDYLTH